MIERGLLVGGDYRITLTQQADAEVEFETGSRGGRSSLPHAWAMTTVKMFRQRFAAPPGRLSAYRMCVWSGRNTQSKSRSLSAWPKAPGCRVWSVR